MPAQVANGKLFTIHHAIGIAVILLIFPSTRFTYCVPGYGIFEGSGFFLGIYRCCQRLRVAKTHPVYVINALCLWLSYTVCRILSPLYYFGRFFLDFASAPDFVWHSRALYDKAVFFVSVLGLLTITGMSFMWYVKINQKIIGALRARSSNVKEK